MHLLTILTICQAGHLQSVENLGGAKRVGATPLTTKF